MLAKFALRNLLRNRRRTAMSILTVGAGLAGLLFIQAFFSGLLRLHSDNSIRSRHGHGQLMTRGYFERSFAKPMDHWLRDSDSLLQRLRSDSRVKGVFPRLSFGGLLSAHGTSIGGRGVGVDGAAEKTFFDRLNFVEGGSIGGHSDGAILGVGLARALGVQTGDLVTIMAQTASGSFNAAEVVVTGIFHIGMKEADDSLFQLQLAKAADLIGTDKVEAIAIALHDEQQWSAVAAQYTTPEIEALSVYQLDQAWAENGRKFLTALLRVIQFVLIAVVGLGIYNVASASVSERRREIGMLRANGETLGAIYQMVAWEGLGLAVAGTVFGVAACVFLYAFVPDGVPMPPTPGTNRMLLVPLYWEALPILAAIAASALAVVISVLAAGWQIARTDIVSCLKTYT
jgi:putative ABC transport system permease protein